MSGTSALVLFSGGQDSTVCLAWALARYDQVSTVGFDYGQRHSIELTCRQNVLKAFRESSLNTDGLGEDALLDLSVLGQISETSLTREAEITMSEQGLPSTFVPGRNLIFLTLASAVAYRRAATVMVGGMCETDFSGYPDCRRNTLDAQEQAISLGLDREMVIETPLMHKTKADTFAMAKGLGGDELVEIVVEHTHTCYLGDRSKRHDWGYGCGTCPACDLRANGWDDWQAAGCPTDPAG
ncbi:7-cyano-7-deazaguanine synthase QueC [Ponticaulis sp.]|uniref:7-cyano-7-deazaguanine synthase QueC n=1 Tax=Ponticaulis sp. TaxID=2020902 RepID=UPI000B662E87|nr:7-cyano-7-deazaguanine synthase QueC [Ponticaulis sp.]MAI90286.1 7-cyano-7-deazaguanine synthase QueC [Ponticaulis sp.]OUX99928.1 MAG: 7-cyano-7-deazaguanine synthase QueC [Hyphomonadaceae bacterium TMED5]|tara:strand:- start:263107 stop:263826 length:720 start_codon:yes stop_codon:yes gene_type:complete